MTLLGFDARPDAVHRALVPPDGLGLPDREAVHDLDLQAEILTIEERAFHEAIMGHPFGPVGSRAFESLRPTVLSCTALKVNTLYETGRGSTLPIGRNALVIALGSEPTRLFDMNTFAQ